MIVVDDSLLTRSGIVALLTAADVDVVAESGDAVSAVRQCRQLRPDAALLDIRMPPTHTDEGSRLAVDLPEDDPDLAIPVLSQYLDSSYAARLLAELPERSGYLLKDDVGTRGVLVDSLRRVTAGRTVVDPVIVARLFERRTEADLVAELPRREREVLALVAEGLSNGRSPRGCSSPSARSSSTSPSCSSGSDYRRTTPLTDVCCR